MLADANLAAVGRVLGDAHRARFVLALTSGQELTAGELAACSGASSSLASAHLSKLLEAGLVSARKCGRQRLYRLAGADVAHAIEALLTIAAPQPPVGLREANRGRAIQRGRTCYDHLAGVLGTRLMDALLARQVLAGDEHVGYRLTESGTQQLQAFGIDFETLPRRRPLIRCCVDWSERRPHLAGSLGAALASRMFDLDWLRRTRQSRAVRVTEEGYEGLRQTFGLELAPS